MASKKTKKQTKLKKAARTKLAKRKPAPKKKVSKKKPALQKAKAKTKTKIKIKTVGKKAAGAKRAGALKKRVPRGRQSGGLGSEPFELQERRSRSAGQSGDLQGLSDVEGADSESVDELIEEGNAFEADAVSGVERAGDDDEQEVRTHEVPEDDVPEEYLDKD
jgi:hypothetical protein